MNRKNNGYRSERKEINAVVDYLDRYCRERGVEKARQLWTAKLPEQLRLRDVVCAAFDGAHWETQQQGLRAVIGLLDDPAAQSQRPMSLNFSESGGAVHWCACDRKRRCCNRRSCPFPSAILRSRAPLSDGLAAGASGCSGSCRTSAASWTETTH